MAEKPGKPGGKKPEPKKVGDVDAGARLVVILIILAVLGGIVRMLSRRVETDETGEVSFIQTVASFFTDSALLQRFFAWLHGSFLWISILISLIAGGAALYSYMQLYALKKKEREERLALDAKLVDDVLSNKNAKWERVETLVSGESPGDWRVAIIEADIMLFELVRSMGYHGDSLGDMLKGVEQSDFKSIDLAWEAHKIRNRIAHSGSDYILTHREAKRIIDLFRQVFQEFQYI